MALIGRCCCLSLKTGCIILGALSLIFPVGLAGACIAVLIAFAITNSDSCRLENPALALQTNQSLPCDQNISRIIENIDNLLLGHGALCFGMILILAIFCIVATSLLIHGARRGRPSFLVPYMLMEVSAFTVQLAGFIYLWIYLFQLPLDDFGKLRDYFGFLPLVLVVGFFLNLWLQMFCFLCVFSHRQQLKDAPAQRSYGMQKI